MNELLLQLAAAGMDVGEPTVKQLAAAGFDVEEPTVCDEEEQALRAEAAKILGNLDSLYCDRVARERDRSDTGRRERYCS